VILIEKSKILLRKPGVGMKVTRKILMRIMALMGVSLILYSIIRHVTGLEVNEELDRNIVNGIIMVAIGVFIYSRKLANDEKLAKEKQERAKCRAEEEPEEKGDENLPHWERQKKNTDSKDGSD
jgi:hypothetical protein